MVSLAVNIAVMGFVLARGVLARLDDALPHRDRTQLWLLAERIAAGNAVNAPGLSEAMVHDALAQGFGWVMLYGALGVWVLAGASFAVFNARSLQPAE
jgi:hypothetical protein